MLILRTSDSEVGSCSDGSLEVELRFSDRLLRIDASPAAHLCEHEIFLIRHNGLVVKVDQGILASQLEVVLRKVCLLTQPLVSEIGSTYLRGIRILPDRVANASPDIRLP